MTATLAIQFAGVILLLIAAANLFAPRKMRWSQNLVRTEPIFQQVFTVHCVFLVGCVVAMATVCLLKPDELLEETVGRLVLAFMAVFWLLRVMVQFFYYERSIKRQYPVYNVLFSVAFIYLAAVFGFLTVIK